MKFLSSGDDFNEFKGEVIFGLLSRLQISPSEVPGVLVSTIAVSMSVPPVPSVPPPSTPVPSVPSPGAPAPGTSPSHTVSSSKHPVHAIYSSSLDWSLWVNSAK